jgi:hypothetical protein
MCAMRQLLGMNMCNRRILKGVRRDCYVKPTMGKMVTFDGYSSPERSCAAVIKTVVNINSTRALIWELKSNPENQEMIGFLNEHIMEDDLTEKLFKRDPMMASRFIETRKKYVNEFGWLSLQRIVLSDIEKDGLDCMMGYLERLTKLDEDD